MPPLARFERPDGRGLNCAYLAGLDVRDKKVLPTGRAAGEAAQHGQLAHVGERIGYGTLKKPFGRSAQRRIGGQKGVQGLERLEEAALFLGQGRGWEACQRTCPMAVLSAQSKRSPMWARICTGRRPAASKPAK